MTTQPRPIAKFGPKLKSLEERFWAKVEVGSGRSCSLWIGCTNGKTGYGMLYDRDTGKKELAHRVAWKLHHGVYPENDVLHECDNPACVKLAHLFEGTHQENMSDMHKKGRGRFKAHYGSSNGASKLNEQQVREIKALLVKKTPHRIVSEQYKISTALVSMIGSGKLWAHVP